MVERLVEIVQDCRQTEYNEVLDAAVGDEEGRAFWSRHFRYQVSIGFERELFLLTAAVAGVRSCRYVYV